MSSAEPLKPTTHDTAPDVRIRIPSPPSDVGDGGTSLPAESTALKPRTETLMLLLLPVVLFLLAPNWIFSGPYRDAWIYYGYYQSGSFYLQEFPDAYYSSRLAVFLPGFVLHHLLPSIAGNVVLHLGLCWTALFSFHRVVKELYGSHTAFLGSLAFGTHPLLLHALGWNYVDGFGITYFLAALLFATWAAQSRRLWWTWSVATGVAITALISTNVFYGIYVPLIAGHFWFLDRERYRQRRLAALASAATGALGSILLMGVVSRVLGGPFFYLQSSLNFLAQSIETENPFRDPTYQWLPEAAWLALPMTTLLGALVLFNRARGGGTHDPGRLMWPQVQLLYLASVLLLFQVAGDTAVLQHFYYASLLLPVVFMALSGQLCWLIPRLDGPLFAGLAVVTGGLLLLPVALPLMDATVPSAEVIVSPLFWALPLACGTALALVIGRRTRAGVLLFFLGLAGVNLVIWQTADVFRILDPYGSDGPGLFYQMSESVALIERFDPSQNVRLWYDFESAHGDVYDAVASAFLLCPRMINLGFPALGTTRMCDGQDLVPGINIVILSNDPAAFRMAELSLGEIGFEARLLDRTEIEGPIPQYALTFLRVEGVAPTPEEPETAQEVP